MECRICFDSTSEPLIQPCKCSGTMKYVHTSCLQKWILHKKNYTCPVCKEEFTIERTQFQSIVSFLLESQKVTTLLTLFLVICIINICVYYEIKPNTLAMSFFIVILGMHSIQRFFQT